MTTKNIPKNVQFSQRNVQNMPKNVRNIPKNALIKPYNMAIIDDDSAEINMYGDVVAKVPKDWYTGERISGYIGVDEFLEDLEDIKDKSNITVHINSGGGDLYAGLAIYNRLKALKGTVTTINDGMAASAASLIFQAGDIRQMNTGSTFMAHGVAGFLFGYYNIDDLKTLVTEFKAHNKAIVNVYAEAMGVSFDEAKGFIDGETWLVGQEAVDKGLADEVIDLDEVDDKAENSMFNRLLNRIQGIYGLPIQHGTQAATTADEADERLGITRNSATPAAVPTVANKNESIETGGKEDMDIKNVEELRNAFPDLVAQIENAAEEKGCNAERARLQGIENISGSISDAAMINDAKYGENPLTAEQLALKAMQKQAAIGANMLNDLQDDANASGAKNVTAAPINAEGEENEDEEKEAKEAKHLADLINSIRK